MNISCCLWVRHELEDHGEDGDEGGPQDGHGVVQVVPRDLGGPEVVNLPEPEPDIHTETGQPEEDGKGGELEEEPGDDTGAGVAHQARVQLVPNNYDEEGEGEEEEEWDLDGGDVVIPELVTGAVAGYDDDDAHDADGHDDEFSCGSDVVSGFLVPTHHGHILCLLDAVFIKLIRVAIDDRPILSDAPVVLGVVLSLLTLELSVDVAVVVTRDIHLEHILCLISFFALIVSQHKILSTAKIDARFILRTINTLLRN